MSPLRRSVLLASLLVLPALAVVPSVDAATVCLPKNPALVCVTVNGTCASVGTPIAADFGAGASTCTTVSAGPGGVSACESAGAGYMTIAGPRGAFVSVCAVSDANGTCVYPYAQVNDDGTVLNPLCLA